MSFNILNRENSNYSSLFPVREFLVTPSDQLLSELPFSKYLDIKPTYGYEDMVDLFLQAIIDFDIHSSDVFVCSLPKCGSSWMQTIVWLLTHGLNYEAAKTLNRLDQMGDFEEISKVHAAKVKAKELLKNDESLNEDVAHKMAWNEVFKTMDTPRVFKKHNPIYFLPKAIWSKGAKVIYIVRNPKDMLVSLYHYLQNIFILQTNSSMESFIDTMIKDEVIFSPILNYVLNFWRVKHLPNILFVANEDLVNDAFASIKAISEFLECKYSDEQLKELTEYISFDNMKKNKAINREQDITRMENLYSKKRPDAEFTFMRKGKVGGYRDDLNDDQIQKIDEWIKSGLKDTDFQNFQNLINKVNINYKLKLDT